jgi:hypothetical protein
MMAVAEVIRRRADNRGVSMLAVLKPGAFSCLNHSTADSLLRRFQRYSQFPVALEIARLAYNEPEKLPGMTRSATHFTHKREKPFWTVGHSPVVTLGNYAVYRLPN